MNLTRRRYLADGHPASHAVPRLHADHRLRLARGIRHLLQLERDPPGGRLLVYLDDRGGPPGASKLRILRQSAVGLGIPLVPQFGDEPDDALRQNIGFLERRKMATDLTSKGEQAE